MIGAAILAHMVGDYLLQSDWMALEKTKRWWPAVAHGLTYTLPYAIITQEWEALAVICLTHIVIDRFRLARYAVWAKNWLAPVRVRRNTGPDTPTFTVDAYNPPWRNCRATGYPSDRPVWMTAWLMIFADNTIHVAINVAALHWLG